MQVVENRGLRLKVRDPQRITTAIPTSKLIGNNEVLVKWLSLIHISEPTRPY